MCSTCAGSNARRTAGSSSRRCGGTARRSGSSRESCRCGSRTAGSQVRPTYLGKEIVSFAVLKPQSPRKARVLRAVANVETLRRIETMALNKQDAEAWQRLPAPARRRASGVRTVLDLDGHAQLLAHPRKHSVHVCGRQLLFGNVRLPGQPEHAPSPGLTAAQPVSASGDDLDILRRRGRSPARSAEMEHLITPHDERVVEDGRDEAPVRGPESYE